jgi:hypothetical protein
MGAGLKGKRHVLPASAIRRGARGDPASGGGKQAFGHEDAGILEVDNSQCRLYKAR